MYGNGAVMVETERLSEAEAGLIAWIKKILEDRDVKALRAANTKLRTIAKVTVALCGPLWDGILASKTWQQWGYDSWREAIHQEAPVSYASVCQSVAMFRYCLSKGMSFEQYIRLAIGLNIDKMLRLKFGQVARTDIDPELAELVPQDFVVSQPDDGTEMVEICWIKKTFSLTPDMNEQIETAIRHFQDHYADGQGGMACSESAAISYICGDYLSRYGRS